MDARRGYLDFGLIAETLWVSADELIQLQLSGGARLGGGWVFRRASGHSAQTLGIELRVEGRSGFSLIGVLLAWDQAF